MVELPGRVICPKIRYAEIIESAALLPQPVMLNLSEPAKLSLPNHAKPVRTCHVGLSRVCYDFPVIPHAEPSRSFRVGFDPRIFPFFSFPAHMLISISSLTPASFPPVPASSGFTPASVLHYARIRSCFRFFPNPVPLFRLYSCFRPSSLYPHSLLFPIFPQSRPASSGFTPVFVLHYTRIRSY
mgnify:CR=1 FL=1